MFDVNSANRDSNPQMPELDSIAVLLGPGVVDNSEITGCAHFRMLQDFSESAALNGVSRAARGTTGRGVLIGLSVGHGEQESEVTVISSQ